MVTAKGNPGISGSATFIVETESGYSAACEAELKINIWEMKFKISGSAKISDLINGLDIENVKAKNHNYNFIAHYINRMENNFNEEVSFSSCGISREVVTKFATYRCSTYEVFRKKNKRKGK